MLIGIKDFSSSKPIIAPPKIERETIIARGVNRFSIL
jgi:hypothetical protein